MAYLWTAEDGKVENGKKRLTLYRISRKKISYNRILELFVATLFHYKIFTRLEGGTRWLSRLRHCATSRKVAGSIPDVPGNFYWQNPSCQIMALGSTYPVTEMSTRNISWGDKGGRCLGLTTLSPSSAKFHDISEPETPGTLRACHGNFLNYLL